MNNNDDSVSITASDAVLLDQEVENFKICPSTIIKGTRQNKLDFSEK